MIRLVISSFVVTVGFGIIFHVKGKKLFFAALGASIGSVVSFLCTKAGYHYFLVHFFTAIVFSLYAEVMSRYLKTPVTILLISEIICFVPGGLMYQTMEELIRGNNALSMQYGFEALASAAALALGIMVSASIFKVQLYWQGYWNKRLI